MHSSTAVSVSSTWRTSDILGPFHRYPDSSESCSGIPTAYTSTLPSSRFLAHPRTPSPSAACCTKARKPTPCTRPFTTYLRANLPACLLLKVLSAGNARFYGTPPVRGRPVAESVRDRFRSHRLRL